MCTAVAVAYGEFPLAFLEAHGLDTRVHRRGTAEEVRFSYQASDRVLPVWHRGEFRIVRWGGRSGSALPESGWTWQASVAAGKWADWHAEDVVILATSAYEGGIWFRTRQGIRGVLVADEAGEPAVYMMIEPASHYYRNMTKAAHMPVLIGERI